jgi:nucleotide-binding universal stress UspA family protein
MQNAQNTILVPVDFSDISMHALNHAVNVAKHFNNRLALLHIVEEALLSSILSLGKNDQKEDLAREAVEARLNKISTDIKSKHGIESSVHVKFGRIYKTVAETATELGCDSIIMGSNGASGLDQIIGSNASRVISYAKVPVVVVKSEQTSNTYKQIVFPLDLTIESRQKVKWAVHLGKSYQATIHILTYKTGDEFLNNKMTGALKQIESILQDNKVNFTRKVLDSDDAFADKTLAYAEELKADLVMVMTQQEDKDFNEYIIGTYAQQMVNKSERIPILCVNPSPTGFLSSWGD